MISVVDELRARFQVPIISVFGNSISTPGGDALAFEVGQLLAKKGCAVANGGYGGVMTASARGARLVKGEAL